MLRLFGRPDWGLIVEAVVGIDDIVFVVVGICVCVTLSAGLVVEGA